MTRKRIGIMAGILLILSAGGYLGLKLYIEKEAVGRIQQWANQSAGISSLSYHSMDVGFFSKTVQVSRVSLQIKDTDSPVAIDKLMLYSFDSKNQIPSFMHVGYSRNSHQPEQFIHEGGSASSGTAWVCRYRGRS